ncbi:formylglycine-generating enzyme family protein [Actinocorallia longicatena]|uniref:SUMF1/EgtB/PvdO family nonheme iron enzyme n=1 Tax=Actinocorallia longicatena TaxID=111803 RepID=A0ABP6Q8V1_9ACTN
MIDIPAGELVLDGRRTRVEGFLLAAFPVTREQYLSVCGEVPAGPQKPGVPVTEVSWLDAVRFCDELSRAEGFTPCYTPGTSPDAEDTAADGTSGGYRLPTEAEWEHACRAGTSGVRYGDLDAIAWYRGNSGGEVHDAGTREPNAWGLHDMIGNVWEWCWDLYDPKVYGPYRVFRGGGAHDRSWSCQASARRKSHPTFRIDDLGFRVARSHTLGR